MVGWITHFLQQLKLFLHPLLFLNMIRLEKKNIPVTMIYAPLSVSWCNTYCMMVYYTFNRCGHYKKILLNVQTRTLLKQSTKETTEDVEMRLAHKNKSTKCILFVDTHCIFLTILSSSIKLFETVRQIYANIYFLLIQKQFQIYLHHYCNKVCLFNFSRSFICNPSDVLLVNKCSWNYNFPMFNNWSI